MSVIDAMLSELAKVRLDEIESAATLGYQRFAITIRDARIFARAYVRIAKLRESPAFHSLAEEIRSHGYAVRDNPRAQAFRLLYEVMTEVDHPALEKPANGDSNTRLRRIK